MNRAARLAVTCLAALLAAAGCGTSPPATFYALTPVRGSDLKVPDRVSGAAGPVSIGLGPVSFPSFLDRPQVVSRDPGNRLDIDELARWGGTLPDDFVRVLGENLSYLLGTSRILIFPTEVRAPLDFRIVADVLAFEGTPDGGAVLKVRWAILDPNLEQTLAAHEGTYREPTIGARAASASKGESPNRSALVGALSAALGAFSRDVAATVRALPKPVRAPRDGPLQ
jgi:uncharacterized lipoprotein YmbA